MMLSVVLLLVCVGIGHAQTAPDHPDANSGAVKIKEYVAYDEQGRVTEQKNAYGQSVYSVYDDPYVTGSQPDGSYLTSVYTTSDGHTLRRSFAWDSRGRLESITGVNGNERRFEYDGLGRLQRVINAAGETVAEYRYEYATGDPAVDPSYVRTISRGGESPDMTVTAYVDGLGRSWQTHQHAGSDRIVQAQEYDDLGRPVRSYRPFVAGDFNASVPASVPFQETVYEPSPLNRPQQRINEDGTSTAMIYAVETAPSGGLCGQSVVTGTYATTVMLDERNDSTRVFTNALGEEVATQSYVNKNGTVEALTTCFEYDAVGSLTRVIKPQGDDVTYAYDSRGLLTERVSPDAGRTRIRYDAAGNLRFSRDGNGEAASRISYSSYDDLGRLTVEGTESGVTEDVFVNLDPRLDQPFESDTTTWRRVVEYDNAPPANDIWDPSGWGIPTLQNVKSRVAAEAFRSGLSGVSVLDGLTIDAVGETRAAAQELYAYDVTVTDGAGLTLKAGERVTLGPGFSVEAGGRFEAVTDPALTSGGEAWRVKFYSYDDEGRVDRVVRRSELTPDLQSTMAYAYDRQGRVVKQHVRVEGTGTESLTEQVAYWYTYNDRGFVDALYAEKDAGLAAQRPKVADLQISYTPDGQIDQLHFRNMEPISHEHDARGRITQIGNGSPYFTATLNYFADGNIQRMDVHRQKSFSTGVIDGFSYTFNYDGTDRLLSADYQSPMATDSRFDVSVSYSGNGNIQTLRRRDDAGALVDDLQYSYGNGSVNRLQSITDSGSGSTAWDAKSGSFSYDASGNMLTAPAPYNLENATYDTDNLPETITSNGQTILYYYTSEGQRYASRFGSGTGADLDYSVLDGSTTIGRLQRTGGSAWTLTHWNLVLPSGEVVGRLL